MVGYEYFLHSSDKGLHVCAYLGDLPPPPQTCPDGQQVRDWVSLDNLMLKHRDISHSTAIFGSDSPQSNTSWGNSIHPKWET